jgi:hypothetical protein
LGIPTEAGLGRHDDSGGYEPDGTSHERVHIVVANLVFCVHEKSALRGDHGVQVELW